MKRTGPLSLGDDAAFAPGASPFRMNGRIYHDALTNMERAAPGARARIRAALSNEELGRFFDQIFVATSFYDAFPIIPLTDAMAAVTGRTFDEVARHLSRAQAENDIRGVYKLLFKAVSPETVATRMPRLTARYFDFGEVRVGVLDPTNVEIFRTGVPGRLAYWYMRVSEQYLVYAMDVAGAVGPRVRMQVPQRDGEVKGVPTFTLRFVVSWAAR